MEPKTDAQPRFIDYIRPVISRWWLILIAAVVATAAVYVYYARKPNVYSTSTLVFYNDPGNPITGQPDPAQATDRAVQDQATLLYSPISAAAVAAQIHYTGNSQDLLQLVTISSKQGQDFVQIASNGSTPQQSAAITNAFARRLVSSLAGSVASSEQSALKTLNSELAQLPKGGTGSAEAPALAAQIERLKLQLNVPQNFVRQVAVAQPPGGPSSPKPLRNALFALIISLVAAVALAYGLERFDRRLKDPDELEAAYGRSLLAIIPHTAHPAPKREDGEPTLASDFREPFRVLRTNIELASVDEPPRTIVVSSAMPGEGKSTVVRNLSLAFSEAGRRVAVVELDLRHPALASQFGVEPAAGLTEVLRDEVTLDEATLDVAVGLPSADEFLRSVATSRPARNGAHGRNGGAKAKNGASPGAMVTLLLAGARPANPPAVIASDRVAAVLDELAATHDVVIIDSAPVLAVTDTVPLLRHADAALFVGRLDVTTRDTAKRLMEFLARVPGLNLLGIVANDLSRHEAGSYGYGYGYGSYGEEPETGRRRRGKAPAEPPKQPA